ncbi:hypothetical protein Pcinc_033802 [Petrolisthes cinctipes]|uniref:Uncharacterized protein n=2 Tax=Petrolisthes cinctipes TaxID=88211 RepID=A0AAE1ERI5_PETCI|nr:hypothetical protein Pcinc_033802 [Petrolisthes cinctipes]
MVIEKFQTVFYVTWWFWTDHLEDIQTSFQRDHQNPGNINTFMMTEPDTEWSSDGPLMDDLWKKIQLPFLTPPCSPYREDLDLTSPLPQYEDFTTIDIPESFFTMPTTDLPLLEDNDMKVDLESVIDLENDLDGCESGGLACQNLPFSRGTCTSCTQLALAGSELRHDCMWQGTCTAEAHSYHHNHLSDTPTLQQLNSRTHRDSSCYHLTDLLLDPNGALDSFNYLSDFDDLHDDNDDTDDLHHPRPDTPSESSETDTDEDERSYTDDDEEDYIGVSHEEEITTTNNTNTTASTSTSTAVHVDHSYFCPRIPSPAPSTTTRRSNNTTTTTSSSSQQHRSQRYHSRSSRLQASTDSVANRSPD